MPDQLDDGAGVGAVTHDPCQEQEEHGSGFFVGDGHGYLTSPTG